MIAYESQPVRLRMIFEVGIQCAVLYKRGNHVQVTILVAHANEGKNVVMLEFSPSLRFPQKPLRREGTRIYDK